MNIVLFYFYNISYVCEYKLFHAFLQGGFVKSLGIGRGNFPSKINSSNFECCLTK